MSVLAILLALVAAGLFAVGTVFEQKGAMQESGAEALRVGFLLRLVRKPIWLIGVLADALGYAAQAGALGVGKLIVVQPLLVASVVFALPLGVRMTSQRIGRREVLGAAVVCIGLVVFMLVSNPTGGRTDAAGRDWLVAGGAIGAVAALHTLGSLGRSAGMKAALLGTAAGTLFGFVSALTKSTVDRFDDGLLAVVGNWHVYALIGASLVGFSLLQASLQTGALAPSVTTSMVFETIAGVTLGIVLLGEDLHEHTAGLAVSAASLAAILLGVIVLAGSQAAPPRPEDVAAEP
jgi:hypothetical protein